MSRTAAYVLHLVLRPALLADPVAFFTFRATLPAERVAALRVFFAAFFAAFLTALVAFFFGFAAAFLAFFAGFRTVLLVFLATFFVAFF